MQEFTSAFYKPYRQGHWAIFLHKDAQVQIELDAVAAE